MLGFPYADVREIGSATLVVTDRDPALADVALPAERGAGLDRDPRRARLRRRRGRPRRRLLHVVGAGRYSEQEPQLKQPDIEQAMQKMQENMIKKAQEVAEANLKTGDEYLAKNKTKQGVKTTESGLQYEIVTEGTGAVPTDTDVVKVHYTGTLINGEKFDSSRDRNEPAEFPVRGVIPGWTEALKLMKVGTRAKLTIPARLAYGPQSRPGIPGNSTLLFDVELLEIKAAPPAGDGHDHGDEKPKAAAKPALKKPVTKGNWEITDNYEFNPKTKE